MAGKVIGFFPINSLVGYICFALVNILNIAAIIKVFVVILKPKIATNPVTAFLGFLGCIFLLKFNIFSLISTWKYNRKFEMLIVQINKIDFLLKHESISRNSKSIFLKLLFKCITLIIFQLFTYIAVYLHQSWDWAFLDTRVLMHRCYLIFFICQYIELLYIRCTYIEQYIKQIFSIIDQNINDMNYKIRKAKQMITLVNKGVNQVNKIFGLQILTITICAFIDFIDIFNACLTIMQEVGDYSYKIYILCIIVMYCFALPVSNVIFIFVVALIC